MGEQNPDRLAERSREVRDGRVYGDDEIEIG